MKIAEGAKKPADRVRAIDVIGKYSGLQITKGVSEDEVRSRLMLTLAELDKLFHEWFDEPEAEAAYDEVKRRMRSIWV